MSFVERCLLGIRRIPLGTTDDQETYRDERVNVKKKQQNSQYKNKLHYWPQKHNQSKWKCDDFVLMEK